MARTTRTHLPPSKQPKSPLIPKHLAKEEFARRLYKLMLDRGWRQADLARQADLPRNAISVYMRGASLPTPNNLEKLAQAFDMKPETLLPNYTESAIERDNPEMEMRVSPGDSSKAWLRINRLVHTSTAVKILALLESDDANKSN
jgi:transcriptional regulator with XRE-family HTH domain